MTLPFALNHVAAPRRDLAGFFDLARDLGLDRVELRNDLPGTAIEDGTLTGVVRDAAQARAIAILSINALQRFNEWNPIRATEAEELADYAVACGARALVLCPVNSVNDTRGVAQRADDLREALAALRPMLGARRLTGLVEPLGFAESSLRRKRDAIDAIDAVGGADVFCVLHDTFHHFLSGETEIFPDRTGLAHISGVEDRRLARGQIRDAHRGLVGPGDIVGNFGQIAALRRGGYAGPLSFEPFSPAVQDMVDVASALRASMAMLEVGLA